VQFCLFAGGFVIAFAFGPSIAERLRKALAKLPRP
jgi:hypothetical protein